MTCSVTDCGRPAVTAGLCNAHYLRLRLHGDTQPEVPIRVITRGRLSPPLCSTGCGKVVLARGWCATHYQRWRTTGAPGDAQLLRQPGDPAATEKRCRACGEVKPVDEFYVDKRNTDGRMSHCRSCMMDGQKDGRRQRLYGLSRTDYEALGKAQRERCPICKRATKLVVDHCHRSGKVRALLCDRCNRLLGVAGDDVALLQASIRFLKKHQT